MDDDGEERPAERLAMKTESKEANNLSRRMDGLSTCPKINFKTMIISTYGRVDDSPTICGVNLQKS